MAFFKIGGVDIIRYIASNGIAWTENDLDSSDSGRTLDGIMHRGKIAGKVKIEISCKPLHAADCRVVLNALSPEFVTVQTDFDPKVPGNVTRTMYNSSRPATCATIYDDGEVLWENLKFTLIEQ